MERNKLLFTLLLSATLMACSSTKNDTPRTAKQLKVVQNQLTEINQKLDTLKARYEQGRTDRLRYFAPEPFQEAAESMRSASSAAQKYAVRAPSMSALKDMNKDIDRSNRYLDTAYAIKQNAETILAESFDIESQLNRLNADKLYPREYKSLIEDLNEIVEDIADGDLKSAQEDNNELLPELRELEVRVVTQIELEGVRAMLEGLKKNRADRYVPSAYRAALIEHNRAKAVIAQDTRNGGAISQAVADAHFAGSRAEVLIAEMDRLRDISAKTREDYLVRFENMLLNMSKSLLNKDIRNLPFEEQVAKLSSTSSNMDQQVTELQAALEQQQQAAEALTTDQQAQIEKMDADKASLWHKIQQQEQQILARSKVQQTLQNKIVELNSVIGELQNLNAQQSGQLSQLQKENAELTSELSTLKTTTVE